MLWDGVSGGDVEGASRGDCWVRDQVANDSDRLGSHTFALVRNSDQDEVCSQGTRHFLRGTPSCSDFSFIATSHLSIVLWLASGLDSSSD